MRQPIHDKPFYDEKQNTDIRQEKSSIVGKLSVLFPISSCVPITDVCHPFANLSFSHIVVSPSWKLVLCTSLNSNVKNGVIQLVPYTLGSAKQEIINIYVIVEYRLAAEMCKRFWQLTGECWYLQVKSTTFQWTGGR